MRILVLASIDPTVPNACVTHLDGVASAFAEAGHETTLILPRSPAGVPVLEPGTRPYTIEYVPYGGEFGLPRVLSFVVQAPWILWKSWKSGTDIIFIRSSVLSWPITMAMSLLTRNVVATEHNGWIEDELRVLGHPRWRQRLGCWFQLWDAHFSDLACCVTSGLARTLRSKGLPAEKVMVVANGTDLNRFRPIPRDEALTTLKLAADKVYIGFIGSLATWHGVHIAIQALPAILERFPNVHMLVAGRGAESETLMALAAKLKVSAQVSFLGHVPVGEANGVVNCFDLAVAPFVLERNSVIGTSALKIRDYAAAGRAILAADIPEVAPTDDRDWLRLCAPDDVDAFAQGAIEMIADENMRRRLGVLAREHAEKCFGWSTVVSEMIGWLIAKR